MPPFEVVLSHAAPALLLVKKLVERLADVPPPFCLPSSSVLGHNGQEDLHNLGLAVEAEA
jgi:hypothetical protein